MKYNNIIPAEFLNRKNRFIAKVKIDGTEETVHVKNTGRCKELLIEGTTVYLSEADNPARKTKYDLIAVIKNKNFLINIDSQAPNKVTREWLEKQDFDLIKPEFTYGNSRLDFYMKKGEKEYLMEVKGCTLEKDGIGYFPYAPTSRGVRHLKELIKATKEGYKCYVVFVIQMENVFDVKANVDTHPEFGEVLREAEGWGVNILMLPCKLSKDSLEIDTEKIDVEI